MTEPRTVKYAINRLLADQCGLGQGCHVLVLVRGIGELGRDHPIAVIHIL